MKTYNSNSSKTSVGADRLKKNKISKINRTRGIAPKMKSVNELSHFRPTIWNDYIFEM